MNRSSLLLVISLFGALTARAELLYENGPPDQQDGFEMTRWLHADDFTLGTAARLEHVKFWDAEGPGSFEGTITWQIYSNAQGNTVGTLLASGTSTNLTHIATGLDLSGYPEFITTFDITPVFLPAGVYWLALHNGPLTNTPVDSRFYWETTANVPIRPSRFHALPFAGPWFTTDFPPGRHSDCAFEINGTISPAALAVAVSRKTHGATGDFDIDLPRTGPSGIECRSGGANGAYHIVVTFPSEITFNNATLTGSGSVVGFGGSGTAIATVDLTSVTNAQYISVKLEGVNDGITTTDVDIPMGVLVGDTNGNGLVNAGDSTQTRSRSGQTTSATNFRSDVTGDGSINSGDQISVRSRSGTSLP